MNGAQVIDHMQEDMRNDGFSVDCCGNGKRCADYKLVNSQGWICESGWKALKLSKISEQIKDENFLLQSGCAKKINLYFFVFNPLPKSPSLKLVLIVYFPGFL